MINLLGAHMMDTAACQVSLSRQWHIIMSLVIKDTIMGSFNVAQARYHFHQTGLVLLMGNTSSVSITATKLR